MKAIAIPSILGGILLSVFSFVASAQPEQDCSGAIRLCTSTYVQNNAYVGFGSVQELSFPGNTACLQSLETNSAWYTFRITVGGNLLFQIDPIIPTDDYDFALFDITNLTCAAIANGTATELRCNFSNTVGSTGLNAAFANTTAASSGPNQCSPVSVSINRTYALLINNFTSSQGGYTISFSGSASIVDQTIPQIDSITFMGCNPDRLRIHLSEPMDCSSVAGDGSDFVVTGPAGVTVVSANGFFCIDGVSSVIDIWLGSKIPVAGTYTLTVQTGSDSNTLKDLCDNQVPPGSSINFTVLFIGPDADTLNVQHTTCGNDDGAVTAAILSGGTAPFTYAWTNGETTATIDSLASGTYKCIVTDANGCTDEVSVGIEVLDQPSITLIKTDVTCFGNNDGSIISTIVGATPPVTYSWSNGDSTPNLLNLAAGQYTLTITDGNNCEVNKTSTINVPPLINIVPTIYEANCNVANGAAKITPNGGTSPYTYQWDTAPNDTTDSIGGLLAGIYNVTVEDANGCINTSPIFITTDVGPSAIISGSNDATCGNANGEATVHASGGILPYSYAWSTNPVQTDSTAVNLAAGFYDVIVTDAAGCVEIVNVKINEFLAPIASLDSVLDADCNTGNGKAFTSVMDGTPPYTYSWSNGQTIQDAVGLIAGTYVLTVTDSSGCSDTVSATIANGPPTSQIDYQAACLGFPVNFEILSNMTIDSVRWGFGDPATTADTSTSITPMYIYDQVGNYTITALLGGDCGLDSVTHTITVSALPEAAFITVPTVVTMTSPIRFQYIGDPAVWFQWDFGDETGVSNEQFPQHTYQDTGKVLVTVVVEDVLGCRDTTQQEVEVIRFPQVYLANAFSPDGDGLNDNFRIVGRGISTVEMMIFNRWGERIFYTADPEFAQSEGWDGTFNNKPVKSDTYVYRVTGLFNNGTEFKRNGVVTVIR